MIRILRYSKCAEKPQHLKFSILLVFFLFFSLVHGQQPAQTVVKADKSKMKAISADKLNPKHVGKNTSRRTLDISKDAIKKERQVSDAEHVVYAPQPDKQDSPLEALKGKKEDFSKRDMSSKHFINDDGTYTALIGGGPIHYDKHGTWEDISHTITPSNNLEYPHNNITNLLESYFGATAHLGVMSKTKEGEVKEFLNTKMYWEVNGQAVNIQNSHNATVTIEDSKAYYHNLFGTIAAEYAVLSGKRKLNYIIPNAQAFGIIPSNAEYLVFSEDIVLPSGWTHSVDKKKGILIKDDSGGTIYAYENPTVYEDYNGELAMPEKDNPTSFEIKKTGNTITLFLKVKTAWLLDADRVFPLAIDPTATVYPDNTAWWSGEAYSDGDEYSGQLLVGRYNAGQYLRIAGFSRFNLTSIPYGSTITNASGYVYEYGVNNPNNRAYGSWSFRNCGDPLITFGIEPTMTTNLSTALNTLGTIGWKNNVLNAQGITYVQNALANDFVALGVFPTGTWVNDTYFVGIRGYGNNNPPYLNITYTAPVGHCIPTISSAYSPPTNYIRSIAFKGTLQDITNNSTYSNPTPRGYQDFTGLATQARQAQGEGVNVYVETVLSGYYKAWIDWNTDNVFSSGELVYDADNVSQSSTTFGFVIPPATPPGNYRIRIRMSGRNAATLGTDAGYNWGPCGNLNYYGETEDYLFTVEPSCQAVITSITEGETCGISTVDLDVTGSAGTTEYRWYTTETGGAPIATTAIGNWTTPTITATTVYYVTAYNGSCESWVRTAVTATYNPVPTVTFNPAAPIVCGYDEIIQLTAEGDTEKVYLIDEGFNSGLGGFTNTNIINNGVTINNLSRWQNRTSTYVPDLFTWKPAISSGFGTNHFLMTTSDIGQNPVWPYPIYVTHNAIVSPSFNTTNFLNLTLELRMFHSRYYVNGTNTNLEYVTIDVSTNGTTWTEIDRLVRDVGIGTKFEELTPYSLNAYINQPNLRVRVRYYGEWCDGLAIDDIKLFGEKPLNTAFDYDTATVDAFIDATGTTPYIANTPITTIYIKPTLLQLESPSFNIPVSATLSNGCAATGITVVTNNTKIYKSSALNWEDNNNWLPYGVPTADNCVIISSVVKIPTTGIPLPPVGYFAAARNLTIKNTGNVELLSGNNLTITDWIHNEGTDNFDIRNDASLLQLNNDVNIGNMKLDRVASVKKTDYVYYSSPVEGYSFADLSPLTPNSVKFRWLPTTNAGGGFVYGNWFRPGAEIMGLGTGYIVRGPSAWTAPQALTASFLGVPRNGNVVVPITRGNFTGPNTTDNGRIVTKDDDNFNLIGNPYPSAISATSFMNNTQNNNILGTVWLWPHGGILSAANPDPFYENYVYNYNSADYITWNAIGSVPSATFSGYIAAGQAFFVLMTDTGASSESLYFNNSMRVIDNNSQFLRTSSESDSNTPNFSSDEPQRIYLDLIQPNSNTSSILVGYIEGATSEADRLFDSPVLDNSTQLLYSKIGEENMIIQGRPMPLDQNDQVPLGVLIPQQGIYTIAINNVNGLFLDADQKIYLEDRLTGIIHNLKTAPYTFTANEDRYDDRFVLRYTNDVTLGIPELANNALLKIIKLKSVVKITSENSPIEYIALYDASGRLVIDFKNVNANAYSIKFENLSQGTYIVKVSLQNGVEKTKKIIH